MWSDEDLVSQFQAGDTSAFEAFVRRHQDRIYRLACVNLYAPEHAADATQEVFLRALTGLKGFRFRAQPFTWLFQTLRNVCRELNRRKGAEHSEVTPDELADGCGLDGPVDARRTVERMRGRLAGLPRRQRDAVLLRVFEEMSVNEVAAVLGCRPGTIKALVYQGLRKMREAEQQDHEQSIRNRQIGTFQARE